MNVVAGSGALLLLLFMLDLFIASVSSSGSEQQQQKKSKVVTTLLNAKWLETSFVLEAMEFLAEEGENTEEAFWDMMDFLAEEHDNFRHLSDKDIYEKVVSFSSRYLPWTQLKLLKFALALRTQSPKIETFQQIAVDRGVSELDCANVVEQRGKLSCELVEEDFDFDVEQPELLKIDHVYPHSAPEALETIILYGQAGTPENVALHNKLKSLASEGKIKYVFRHFLKRQAPNKVRLSGYGVELQIKSTEYKAQDDRKVQPDESNRDDSDFDGEERKDEVGGFIFDKLNSLNPDHKEKLSEFRQHLLDQNNDMAPMKVWQLQDLSMQAAEKIMSSPEENRLKVIMDLSQNFPSHARVLSRVAVRKELKKEIKKNQESFLMNMNVQPLDAALFINGMHFDMDYVDIFTIFETLKTEGRVLDGLGSLGLSEGQARKMISLDLTGDKLTYGIDIRDTAVNWINDIEEDKLYKSWPKNLDELLRPTFPGMLRSIRRNLFNIVIMCDPSKKESRHLLRLLESFYVHRTPTRIGIVFTVNSEESATGETDPGVAFLDAYNYIAGMKSPYEALAFITDVYSQHEGSEDKDEDVISVKLIHEVFRKSHGKKPEVFEEDSEYDVGRQLDKDFIERSGFKSFPQVMMNGVPLDAKNLNEEDFEESIMMMLMRETNKLQRAVYHAELRDSDDVLDFLMKQSNIMPRLNDRILKEEKTVIPMTGDELHSFKIETFAPLDKSSMTSTLARHLKYLTAKDENRILPLSTWIIVDLETIRGRDIARGALIHVKNSKQMRLALINNNLNKPGLITRIVQLAVDTLPNFGAKHLINKVLKEDTAKALVSGNKSLTDYDIPEVDMRAFARKVEEGDVDDVFQIHRTFVKAVLGLDRGREAVILNGRVIGPFDENEIFGIDDFNLLEKFTMNQHGDKLVSSFYTNIDMKDERLSDKAMKIASLLIARPAGKSRSTIHYANNKHSVIHIPPIMPDKPSFDISVIVDPISQGAQKISALLNVLKDVLNARITVYLNAVDKHSEMFQKSYFRMVLEPEITFDPTSGDRSSGPLARFANLPEQPIFTMHYHIPDNWLVEPVKSIHDMDNVKLENIEGNVYSEYELEHLLLEGHCFEAYTGNPPRGLQLTLGTKKDPVKVDTIVMANLGYLQLKGSPGRWFMRLREGRSKELYDIVSHDGPGGSGKTDADNNTNDIQVLMTSFQSHIVKLRVAKKPGKRNKDLLASDDNSSGSGLWNSITSTFTGGGGEKGDNGKEDDDTLNIFCLASGHLYERLLKIMMLSTIRHTKAPVKFWILKSYLSPSLKEFLPEYAARYGFQYEYVQYKWPRWLNQQKEKQRIIWGYKILFLDVMFPLDLKKIIFVDTDQIVRADLTELRDMDLGGAPYGYTPFCNSNKEMDGFRFWKSGYWKNHLAGRAYHISALYVVDLVKFRQIAAGDRLRGQYQALSQDPNSLSNLDQDLPNNMIHQVPIKSLPQDWLWCETWCDQASKATAKSIDLCNNPLTKESKLDAARRIVSEWTDYDDEMQALAEKILADKNKQTPPTNKTSSSSETKHDHSEL